jgi:hypothetical protein
MAGLGGGSAGRTAAAAGTAATVVCWITFVDEATGAEYARAASRGSRSPQDCAWDAQVFLVPDFRSSYGNSGFGLVESRLVELPTARSQANL